MQVINSENIYMFDVDETLICAPNGIDASLYIKNPYSRKSECYRAHTKHISLLITMKARGRTIIVWSANGARWAEAVVKALRLEEHVDYCMSKPIGYVDDLPASEFMQHHIYLKP